MRRATRQLLASAAVVSAIAACDRAAGPAGPLPPIIPTGTYVLRSVDGQTLPAALPSEHSYEPTVTVYPDTLYVEAGDRFRWRLHYEAPAPSPPAEYTMSGHFRRGSTGAGLVYRDGGGLYGAGMPMGDVYLTSAGVRFHILPPWLNIQWRDFDFEYLP